MQAEFEPTRFNLTSPINVEESPLREDNAERLPFLETGKAMEEAGNKIREIWELYLQAGISNHAAVAEYYGERQAVNVSTEDDETGYWVEFLGPKVDGLGQELEAIRLIRIDEADSPLATSITVATLMRTERRFQKLIAFIVQDEQKDISEHHFHFFGDHLYAILQQGKPQTLFFSPDQPDKGQFFNIARNQIAGGEILLRMVIGCESQEGPDFSYLRNLGGSLIESRRLRLNSGEVQVFNILGDGNVYSSSSFYLPQSVVNMAEFEPATAQ